MLDILVPAVVGATVSVINPVNATKTKIVRMWLLGFFSAWFLAEDICIIVRHFTTVELNKGGIVFLVAVLSAVVIEKIIFIIQSFKVDRWYK